MLTDIRDNQQYNTVQINGQCWFASNLVYGSTIPVSHMQRDQCIPEKYCFNNNPANCANNGGLYQWDEMMKFDNTSADSVFLSSGMACTYGSGVVNGVHLLYQLRICRESVKVYRVFRI